MSRSVKFALAWLLAAGVAVTAAWQGVAIVGNQVTEDRPRSLSAREVREALDASGSRSDRDGAGESPGDGTTALPPSPEDEPDPVTTPRQSTTVPPTATTAPPSTTAPSPSTTAAPAETRTYRLTGGSVALQFSPASVTVLWANPNPGFDVEREPEHGNGVKVEFESDTHESRVDGWWAGGPQDRTREEPESSGSDSDDSGSD